MYFPARPCVCPELLIVQSAKILMNPVPVSFDKVLGFGVSLSTATMDIVEDFDEARLVRLYYSEKHGYKRSDHEKGPWGFFAWITGSKFSPPGATDSRFGTRTAATAITTNQQRGFVV